MMGGPMPECSVADFAARTDALLTLVTQSGAPLKVSGHPAGAFVVIPAVLWDEIRVLGDLLRMGSEVLPVPSPEAPAP